MPNFSQLIFDLDGTLVNSKLGINNSLNYMFDQMGVDLNGYFEIDELIGPPIQDGLKNILGFDDHQIELGVNIFREYYSERGMYEAELFPGIMDLLEELQHQGKQIFVATSKKDRYTKIVLDHFELDKYLTDFEGSGDGGKHTKAGLITNLIERNQLVPSENIVMIGDTIFDIVGGKANEISTIGVGYGFGNADKIKELNPDYYAEEVEDLFELLV